LIKHVSAETEIIEKENFNFFVAKNKRGYIARRTVGHLKELEAGCNYCAWVEFPLAYPAFKKCCLVKRSSSLHGTMRNGHAQWPKKISVCGSRTNASLNIFLPHRKMLHEWVDKKIINSKNKIAEIPPTLTVFQETG
jgi:hypothetical protein